MSEPAASYNLADLFSFVAGAVPDREAVVAGRRRSTFGDLPRPIPAPGGGDVGGRHLGR